MNEEPITRDCPNCGYGIKRSTIICPRCGSAVPDGGTMTSQGYSSQSYMPVPPRKNASGLAIILGLLSAQVCAAILTAFDLWMSGGARPTPGSYTAAVFTIIPLAMGIASAFFWRNEELSLIGYFGYSCLNSLLAICMAGFVLHEGVICLMMASPILIVAVWIGSLIGRWMFQRNNSRLNASLVPLIILLVAVDARGPHSYAGSESDTITIKATPQQVWRYIPDYPALTEKPHYWLFSVGLPQPMAATSSGHFLSADRKCIFSRNAIFDEKMVEYEPGKRLTFDIVSEPNDPEIIGHLHIDRGQFILRDNGDGTTTVTGTSWYHLYVYPVNYFDFWTQDVISHVHVRVMEHIKTLAEHQP